MSKFSDLVTQKHVHVLLMAMLCKTICLNREKRRVNGLLKDNSGEELASLDGKNVMAAVDHFQQGRWSANALFTTKTTTDK